MRWVHWVKTVCTIGLLGFAPASAYADDDNFCDQINRVVGRADSHFAGLKGKHNQDTDDYEATVTLPRAEECVVGSNDDLYYECTWYLEDEAAARRATQQMLNGVKACPQFRFIRTETRTRTTSLHSIDSTTLTLQGGKRIEVQTHHYLRTTKTHPNGLWESQLTIWPRDD